jgi:hypothetical protein
MGRGQETRKSGCTLVVAGVTSPSESVPNRYVVMCPLCVCHLTSSIPVKS